MFDNYNVSIHPNTGDVLAGVHAAHNVYYTVNAVRPGFAGSKPSKADITAARFAHVDIDPPKDGGPWDKSALLASLIEAGASVVVDSGNGLQALWRTDCDVPTVEAINRGLIARFNADKGTWNADRLFRVPGYTNYPNPKKRAAGRVDTEALLLWQEDLYYTPEALRAAFPEPEVVAAGAAPELELGEWQVESVESLKLPPDLADMVTTTGLDRSSHAMTIAARLARAMYTNEQIMGLLMNPDYPWSGTIQEQADPERQAARKVRDAATVRPDLNAMFPPLPPESAPAALPEPLLVTAAREAGFGIRTGGTNGLMMGDQQVEHFTGCVYVTSLDRVLMPSGQYWSQSKFDARMGGFDFVIDPFGKKTTRSAWEAFLKNPLFTPPVADERCFRPLEPSRALIDDGSRVLVNTYVPIETPRTKGDPSKWLGWLEKCYPNERDRAILLNYMASVLQNPGRKFFYWPVVQSTEGAGKGLILELMVFGVGRQYCHLPNTTKMARAGMNFNGWIENKLFIVMNEIYSPERRNFLEELKTTITDSMLPIEGKGIEEATLDNYANGILFTNHKDGVPITVDMRRYCILYMALQSYSDLIKAGMTPEYFSDLFNWMRGEKAYAHLGRDYGFRVMNDYLRDFPLVPELDPADLATRAPRSSTMSEAVRSSHGRAEQEILEAIAQGEPGFCGGWVSSVMLDRLLERKRVNLPVNKRRAVMVSLGYDYHPALHEGRVNNSVSPDGSKPRLYILMGSDAGKIDNPAEVAKNYTACQIEAKLGS